MAAPFFFHQAIADDGTGVGLKANPPTSRPSCDVPLTRQRPRMDASPDDPAWANAFEIPALSISKGPAGEGLTSFPSKVLLLWDRNYLYLRFICTGGSLYAPYTGRDKPHYEGDVVEVFLDPKGDAREYVEFELSPANQVFDQLTTLTADPKSDENGMLLSDVISRDWWPNPAWDCDKLITAAAPIKSNGITTGWIGELAIPAEGVLHRLGMDHWQPMTLRGNFLRYERVEDVQAKGKQKFVPMNWAPVVFGCPHISPQAMGFVRLFDRQR